MLTTYCTCTPISIEPCAHCDGSYAPEPTALEELKEATLTQADVALYIAAFSNDDSVAQAAAESIESMGFDDPSEWTDAILEKITQAVGAADEAVIHMALVNEWSIFAVEPDGSVVMGNAAALAA